jgi:hypothetical protein
LAQSIRGDLPCLDASAPRQRIADVACLQHGIEIAGTPMHFLGTPMHFLMSRAKLTAESRNAGARVAVLSSVSFERSSACERLNCRLAVLLATTALVAAAALLPGAARAADATWLAPPATPTGDFDTAANWTPAAVPTGTAFFGFSNTTGLSFSTNNTIGGWTFNSGASAYSFANFNVLNFNGAGIVINGGSASITNDDVLAFSNTSTAGSATITTNSGGETFLLSSASGGTTRFILNGTGSLDISLLATSGTTAGSIEAPAAFLWIRKTWRSAAKGAREATRLQLCNSLEDDTAGHMADGEMVGGKRVEEVYRARRGLWPPGCEPCAGADDCVHHSRRPAIIGMGRTEQHDA